MKYKVFVQTITSHDGIVPLHLWSSYQEQRYQVSQVDSHIWCDHQLPDILDWLVKQGCSGKIIIEQA